MPTVGLGSLKDPLRMNIRVCVHVCRALTRVGTYLSAYNAMYERVLVCVVFSFGGMSYGDNDPLLARR